MSNQI